MSAFTWRLDQPAAGLVRLVLSGEMSLSERAPMRQAFDSLINTEGPESAIDFSTVRMVSSAAIGELARCHHQIATLGRKTLLICPASDVLEILEVADMHRLIPLYPDLPTLIAERALS
jgi:anti-anti-sigma factor